MLQNLETALAGGLGQMSLVKWLPDFSTQSRFFISGNEIQGMMKTLDWVETSGNHLTSDICPNPPASAVSRF